MTPLHAPARIWTIIIPVKDTSLAKTRLQRYTVEQRAALALAFALDAASAAQRCPFVGQVVAVSNDRKAKEHLENLDVVVVPDAPAAGINPALDHAVTWVRGGNPAAAVAAMSADLPALTGPSLAAAIEAAGSADRWFVADRSRIGTTLLAARAGKPLAPRFGPGSAAAHLASGALAIEGQDLATLRRDVDTEADLQEALALGVGSHTLAALTADGMIPLRR